jgi:hypothetical protein
MTCENCGEEIIDDEVDAMVRFLNHMFPFFCVRCQLGPTTRLPHLVEQEGNA